MNLRDAGDPVEVAAAYDQDGADELCFLDITASHEIEEEILDVVARTAEQVFMPVTVGGGVRTLDDIRALLNAGSDKVSINTAAVEHPEFVKCRSRAVRLAMHRSGDRCETRGDATRIAGKCTPMADVGQPGVMWSNGHAPWRRAAPEKFSSPAWTAMARKMDMICH